MVQKHIIISMIAPVAIAGILIMAILANQAFRTGNAAQESNNTGHIPVTHDMFKDLLHPSTPIQVTTTHHNITATSEQSNNREKISNNGEKPAPSMPTVGSAQYISGAPLSEYEKVEQKGKGHMVFDPKEKFCEGKTYSIPGKSYIGCLGRITPLSMAPKPAEESHALHSSANAFDIGCVPGKGR